MKYNVKQLAKMYVENLSEQHFDVVNPSQSFDPSTYNEYTYQKLMKQFELLYNHTSSINLTEEFLKGE
ncbi:MAG: hypothetical protein IJ458_02525 [Clostridia bacterium]|nr:hypothetical protein [Clostridia bacterium]